MVPFDWTLWYTYPAYSVHDQVRPDQAKQVELQYVVIEVHQAVGDQTVRALRRLFVAHPTHHLLHFGMPLALAHAVADPFTLCLLSSGDHQPGPRASQVALQLAGLGSLGLGHLGHLGHLRHLGHRRHLGTFALAGELAVLDSFR